MREWYLNSFSQLQTDTPIPNGLILRSQMTVKRTKEKSISCDIIVILQSNRLVAFGRHDVYKGPIRTCTNELHGSNFGGTTGYFDTEYRNNISVCDAGLAKCRKNSFGNTPRRDYFIALLAIVDAMNTRRKASMVAMKNSAEYTSSNASLCMFMDMCACTVCR